MEAASSKIKKFLILFAVVVLVVKNASMAGMFEAKDHKGKGYYVKVPEGWKKVKPNKDIVYPEGIDVVTFVPQEVDLDFEIPEIYIAVFTKKLDAPMWIEDEIGELRYSIVQAGNRIMDKGQIKIDDKISEWVVYHDPKADALVLEFYMVTDNNVYYKMQYSAPPDDFNVSRKSFEELKDSWKFRFSLY